MPDAGAEPVAGSGARAAPSAVFQRALAAVVLITVVVLPLIFVPGIDDGYALPKAVALRLLGIAGTALFLAYLVAGGPLGRHANAWIDGPLVCFVGLFVAATIVSVDPGQSVAGEPFQYQGLVTGLVYIGAFYAARLSLGTRTGIRAVLLAIVGTGGVVAIYAIAQQLGSTRSGQDRPKPGRSRRSDRRTTWRHTWVWSSWRRSDSGQGQEPSGAWHWLRRSSLRSSRLD